MNTIKVKFEGPPGSGRNAIMTLIRRKLNTCNQLEVEQTAEHELTVSVEPDQLIRILADQ